MIPKNAALRESLIRLACQAESNGPAMLGIDPSTPDGSMAWANMTRAISWIYDNAIDPDRDPGGTFHDAAAADR